MSCRKLSQTDVQLIIGSAQTMAEAASGVLESGRFAFPKRRGGEFPGGLGKKGWRVLSSSSFINQYISAFNDAVGDVIPPSWLQRTTNLTRNDLSSPQVLNEMTVTLNLMNQALGRAVICDDGEPTGYLCFDSASLESVRLRIVDALNIAIEAQSWTIWQPYLGYQVRVTGGDGTFFIDDELLAQIQRYSSKMSTMVGAFSSIESLNDYSFNCANEPPPPNPPPEEPPEPDQDCVAINDNLRRIGDGLENLSPCDEDRIINEITRVINELDFDCPDLIDYDRVADVVVTRIDYSRIINAVNNHIDSKFGGMSGSHKADKVCGANQEFVYTYEGNGFKGIESAMLAQTRAINDLIRAVCSNVEDKFPFMAGEFNILDCNGAETKYPYIGRGVTGLQRQVDSIGRSIERLNIVLCNAMIPNLSGTYPSRNCDSEGQPLVYEWNGNGLGGLSQQMIAMSFHLDDIIKRQCAIEDRTKEFITNALDIYNPEVTGDHTGAACDDIIPAKRYEWAGRGIDGLNSRMRSMQEQMNDITRVVCSGDKKTQNALDIYNLPVSGEHLGNSCDDVGSLMRYSWAGSGLAGLDNHMSAIQAQLNSLSEQVCLVEMPAIIEIEKFARDKDFQLFSQMDIIWIEEHETYGKKNPVTQKDPSKWVSKVPNPRSDLVFDRDFANLRWVQGNKAKGALTWGSGFGSLTYGYFDSENDARNLLSRVETFSSEPLITPQITTGRFPKINPTRRVRKVGKVIVFIVDPTTNLRQECYIVE